MNSVIYARYSSDNQREESIDGQLREYQAFAEKQGITIIDTYIDRAMSAKTDDRPQFQQMIIDSEKKLFDVVIVWKLNRFSRDRYDSAHYKRLLGKNGAKVVSAIEPISNDASGILLESMLEGMAEYYSAELSEKITRGLTDNVLKGKYNGQHIPLGLRVDEDRYFTIDEKTAPLVLEMFKMYGDGRPLKKIAEWLNSKGVRSSHEKPISVNSMTVMLHNRKYIGEYRHGDTVNPDAIPPIVPKDLFDRVQARFEANKRAPAKREVGEEEHYLLTTKLICGSCDTFMSGESGTSRTGKTHRYYKCSNAKRGRGCKRKAIKKELIEDYIVCLIRDLLFDDKLIDRLANTLEKVQESENVITPVLRQELAEVEKKIGNVLDAIDKGVLTPSTKERLEAHEARRDELKASIATEEIRSIYIPRDLIKAWLLRFRDTDPDVHEQRQRLVDTFVNSIYVFDDRIVATFNYRDKSRTVKLSDIRGSSLLDSAPPGSKETLKYQRFFALKGRAEGSNQNHQTRTRTTESSRSVTDLLLYHRGLQRLIAFDFKRDEVTPSNLGQLSFYLSALNKFVKKPFENDSIGIILCKKQNKAVVELAIQDYKNPIGVATYRFGGEIPAPYQTLIPVIDGVQQILLESSDDSEEEAK